MLRMTQPACLARRVWYSRIERSVWSQPYAVPQPNTRDAPRKCTAATASFWGVGRGEWCRCEGWEGGGTDLEASNEEEAESRGHPQHQAGVVEVAYLLGNALLRVVVVDVLVADVHNGQHWEGGGKIQNTTKGHLRRSRMVQISAPYIQSENFVPHTSVWGDGLENAQFS